MDGKTEQNYSEVMSAVECWFSRLQIERKCNSTNTISKTVNELSDDVQEQVRKLICHDIKTMICKCMKSRDLTEMLKACNTINGCFDNFVHAADAVRYSIADVLLFIDCALDECKMDSQKNGKTLILVSDLLHCISRILILILKLRRSSFSEKGKHKICNSMLGNIEERKILALLTSKIGPLLMREDILIDTKNNFAMSGILIREILFPNIDDLKEYHRQLISTISFPLRSENIKKYLLQYLMSSAVLNTWSTKILDDESTYTYLMFFISLCENFSSETPIILNTSRTLLFLIKQNCFNELLEKCGSEKLKAIANSLLSCVIMLLEHPVPCVRHSAKEFLTSLVSHSLLQAFIIKSTFNLPKDKRSYFISLAAIANEMGSRVLIEKNSDLPKELFENIQDPTMISHVSLALENIILKDSLAEEKFNEWCELWIIPLLLNLKRALPTIAAEIDKLLENAFKKYPNCILYITEKWKQPKSEEELRCVITALKIYQKQCYKFKIFESHSTTEKMLNRTKTGIEVRDLRHGDAEEKWKTLITVKLLQHCLHHGEDEIRIAAFALVVEARRSTESYSKIDFDLIQYFLKYNVNNQQPATRQKIISLIRKMLVRFSDSRAAFQKNRKADTRAMDTTEKALHYEQFINSLVEFCFSNIFVGCNFNRLNTVLNILTICFETLKDMTFNSEKTNYYWNKFLIALDSSYEENKELTVDLCKKLDFTQLKVANQESTQSVFEKAFSLISHMEPPDVLTGSYFLMVLISLPLAKNVLIKHFLFEESEDDVDVYYCCIQILARKLKEEVLLAKLDLMTAATCGPMYGTLSAIRLIFKAVNFNTYNEETMTKWKKVLNDLREICFEMIPIVATVVNSSSPEGHIPMDFQTDFENLLQVKCDEDSNLLHATEEDKIIDAICCSFFKKFERFDNAINSCDYDKYEILRGLKCLLKENKLLCQRLENSRSCRLKDLKITQAKIEHLISTLDKNNSAVDWPATAQVLLLCAWRSIKEAALYLGDFVSKLPIETAINREFLTEESLTHIGEELKILLCEIKHRGSFEHVYVAFSQYVNCLWKCSYPALSNLPKFWLEEISNHLELPISEQKLKLCSTRRSAGLPFLVQAVICSEIVSVKSPTPSTLHGIMNSLLKITEKGVVDNSDSIIHALNILRALFKHAQLGEHVSSYISKALMVAIRGSRGRSWSERNSSNLLFSSLVIRIFGVARSRDEISKKNRMTSRTFFQRYPDMYEYLLAEMKFIHSNENSTRLDPKPSLYLILLILGRLYPTPREDTDILDLSEFLPYINKSRQNPILKIRELAARAVVPLIPPDKLLAELNDRFALLSSKIVLTQNEMHGILLQIKALLKESMDILEDLIRKSVAGDVHLWIENTNWILQTDAIAKRNVSFVVISSYISILHILFSRMPSLRKAISNLVLSIDNFGIVPLIDRSILKSRPGFYLCLENFYSLKADIAAFCSLQSREFGNFFHLFMDMLNHEIYEVQSIPLRILCSVLRREIDVKVEDDLLGVGASVSELLVLQKKETVVELRKTIQESEIPKCVLKALSNSSAKKRIPNVVHRLLLKSSSGLIIDGGVSFTRDLLQPLNDPILKTEALEPLLVSNDKEISSHAILIYSACMFEKIVSDTSDARDKNITRLSMILKRSSSADADVKEKLAVAKVMIHCFAYLTEMVLIDDMNLWMIPVKLVLDEDFNVRMLATNFVWKMQVYLGEYSRSKPLAVQMEILEWPVSKLVSLKAQECLLDAYVSICPEESLDNLIAHMFVLALSSLCSNTDYDGMSNEEFGVFEKGNPNPYCEELAVSNMICDKLTEFRKNNINLRDLMRKILGENSIKILTENFNLSQCKPNTLMEVIEIIMKTNCEKSNDAEFSNLRTQQRNLLHALDLKEVI